MVRYLIGRRDAIEQIARTPRAVWLGLLFVLSAGFAREYDGEYLIAESWHLLVPLVASLGTSIALYILTNLVSRPLTWPLSYWANYPRFLALYWMTAPLAWLYAIPFERFLSAFDATAVNLSLLAIVSVWRVTLMIRVVSVRWNAESFWSSLVVLLFGDGVALIAIINMPRPVISMMGGVRHTASEALISIATCQVFMLGSVALPFLALLTLTRSAELYCGRGSRPEWQP